MNHRAQQLNSQSHHGSIFCCMAPALVAEEPCSHLNSSHCLLLLTHHGQVFPTASVAVATGSPTNPPVSLGFSSSAPTVTLPVFPALDVDPLIKKRLLSTPPSPSSSPTSTLFPFTSSLTSSPPKSPSPCRPLMFSALSSATQCVSLTLSYPHTLQPTFPVCVVVSRDYHINFVRMRKLVVNVVQS